MKNLLRYLWVSCVLFMSLGASAHNPDLSSTLLVDQGGNKWVLQIRAALTAFEYEVETQFGENAFATPEEFQELVAQHVRNNLAIQFNDQEESTLSNGLVKLGHETSVSFDLEGPTSSLEFLKVQNSSFKDIPRNKGALRVLRKDFAKDQFTLDNKNNHTAELKVNNSKFELVTSGKGGTNKEKINETQDGTTIVKSNNKFYYVGGALVLLVILFLLFKSRSN